jgi:phosphoglycolate phosphatase
MFEEFDNYIFDMDGTLVDTSKDVIAGLRGGFEKENVQIAYSNQDLIDFVGPPLETMVENMAPCETAEKKAQIVKSFRECYSKLNHENSKLYEGVRETLETLQKNGKKLFVATNKPKKFAQHLLDKFNLTMFEELFTSDYFDGKLISKSEMLEHLILKHKIDREKTVMIGDSKADIIGANDNELKSFFVTYGFGHLKDAPKPTYVVDKLKDIL